MIIKQDKLAQTQTLRSDWGRKSLRVDALVPTGFLKFKLGRTHVGTTDAEVTAMIEERIAAQTDPGWTDALIAQTIEAALWIHHENRAEYTAVMSGRL